MNNEPVAIRYDFDGYFYLYMDSGSGSDWQTRVEGEFLYTHPAKEELDTRSYLIGRYDSAKTLTDEEITEIFDTTFEVRDFEDSFIKFARAILKKASEK